MPKTKKVGIEPNQKKPVVSNTQSPVASAPDGQQQPHDRVISPTIRILQKIYGETAPETVWPDLVDEGGYVVLGCEVSYNRNTFDITHRMPPEHTWCRWGWDMGIPVRFGSVVDAEAFAKSLILPDDKGKMYARSYVPMVFFTEANPEYATRDEALPRRNYYEDED